MPLEAILWVVQTTWIFVATVVLYLIVFDTRTNKGRTFYTKKNARRRPPPRLKARLKKRADEKSRLGKGQTPVGRGNGQSDC
jgi:hypothetical protein